MRCPAALRASAAWASVWVSSSRSSSAEGVGLGLSGLIGGEGYGDDEAGGLSASEADVEVDLVGLVDGDVFDEQPGDAFAFSDRGGRVGPQRGSRWRGADVGLVVVVKARRARWLLAGIGRWRRCSSRSVSFQSASRLSATRRLSGSTVSSGAGPVGAVAGSLHVAAAQRVGLLGAGFEFGLDSEGDFQGDGGDGVEQELADGRVDGGAGHGVAGGRAGSGWLVPCSDSRGPRRRRGCDSRWSFAARSGRRWPGPGAKRALRGPGRVRSSRMGGGVQGQGLLVGFEGFPADVAGVGVKDKGGPLLSGELLDGHSPLRGLAAPVLAIGERSGVAGVVQGAQHPPVVQGHPGEFALAWTAAHPCWKDRSSSPNAWTVARAEPVRGQRLRRGGARPAARRRRGRGRPCRPGHIRARPGAAWVARPRRALDKLPPRRRARMKCSSASYAALAVMPTNGGIAAQILNPRCMNSA